MVRVKRSRMLESAGAGFCANEILNQNHESSFADLRRQAAEIRDQERGRIGLELHDNLCQLLCNLSLELRLLCKDLQVHQLSQSARADRIEHRLHEAMRVARRLAHDLCPVTLCGKELGSALHTLACTTTQDCGVSCTAECNLDAAATDSITATNLYLIAREAVHNAVKHAEPHRIYIQLAAERDCFRLEVINDGRPFPDPLPSGGGVGLQIMQHRAGQMGGRLDLRRSPGGTVFACIVPRRNGKTADNLSGSAGRARRLIQERQGIPSKSAGVHFRIGPDNRVSVETRTGGASV